MDTTAPLIPFGKARAELADLCARVAYSGQRVVITRHGRPLVGIVPLDETGGCIERSAAIQTSVRIGATLGTVWHSLTSGRAPKWWDGHIEPIRGGWVRDGQSNDFGKVLEVDPGELIRGTWPGGGGEFTITLSDDADSTILVTVTHQMEPAFWSAKLADLKGSCEDFHA